MGIEHMDQDDLGRSLLHGNMRGAGPHDSCGRGVFYRNDKSDFTRHGPAPFG
jgi:hypothetical protein